MARLSVRALDPAKDGAAVAELYDRASDYVLLETGEPPGPQTVAEFFDDAPPGGGTRPPVKLGLWAGDRLDGIGDLAFGWPEPGDAYIGLMLLAPEARGSGRGAAFLREIETIARAAGAKRLLLAVLDENARGRAFWEREGFRVVWTAPPATLGRKVHVRHRMAKPL